jgi:beta-N-acetylhexosaminidase
MNFYRRAFLKYLLYGLFTVVALLILLNFSIGWRIQKIEKLFHASKAVLPAENEKISVESEISNILKKMTDKEKIGQLIMVNYFGEGLEKVYYLITNCGLSGFMLTGENVRNKTYSQIQQINKNLIQASSGRIPLVISIDQEGGTVSRLNGILKNFPAPADVYQKDGKEGVLELADYNSKKLKGLNIQINFSPVLDVVYKTNSIIYKRSFSANSSTNAELGRCYLEKAKQNGIIAAAKHFPGYGNMGLDPHEFVCVDRESSLEELAKPFLETLDFPMIMSSHVIFSRYDKRPATLSRKIIAYLRENHYSNVIITDDIQMKSITQLYDYRKASLEAVLAGCDIVLSVTKDPGNWYQKAVELYNYLYEAYKSGALSEEAVNQSLSRILKMKLAFVAPEYWGIVSTKDKTLSVK